MSELDFNHDKTVRVIEDLLKSFPDGLTITDIIKKTGLARNTVLTRLYFLVGRGDVGMRQINMAKLHYWKASDEDSSLAKFESSMKEEESEEREEWQSLEDDIQMVPLKAKHIKKVMTNPKANSKVIVAPEEMYAHNDKDGAWKDEKNVTSCINLIEEAGDSFEKDNLNKAKECYKKIQKVYPLISAEAKEHLAPGVKKLIEEINRKEIESIVKKYVEVATEKGLTDKMEEKILSLSEKLPKEDQDEVHDALEELRKKKVDDKEEIESQVRKYVETAMNGGLTDEVEKKILTLSEKLPKEDQDEVQEALKELRLKVSGEGRDTKDEDAGKLDKLKQKIANFSENTSSVEKVESVEKVKTEPIKKAEGGRRYPKLDFAAIKAEVRSGVSSKENSDSKEEIEIEDENFIKTHVPGFDKLMEKGIPRGSAILMAGGCGSGKTLFTLQTLIYQANQGKKCLFMSFEETADRLVDHMESFGWNARELVEKGLLVIKRFNPYDITRSVDALLMKAKGELMIDVDPIIFPDGFKPDFIVVDSLTAIGSAFASKEDSYRIYIEQLFRFFENIDATSFLITETQQIPTVFSTTGVEEFLADGVFVIYNFKRGSVRENAMEILKLRGAKHRKKIAPMKVTDKGITVYPDQEVYGGAKDR